MRFGVEGGQYHPLPRGGTDLIALILAPGERSHDIMRGQKLDLVIAIQFQAEY